MLSAYFTMFSAYYNLHLAPCRNITSFLIASFFTAVGWHAALHTLVKTSVQIDTLTRVRTEVIFSLVDLVYDEKFHHIFDQQQLHNFI
jgi:hypothetical protein